MIRALFLAPFMVATAACADVPARLEQAFTQWIGEVGAEAAVLTIWRKGEHQRDVALGMAADAPVELASLSKAITALCAAQLIETGVWSGQTSSLEVLGYGPADASVAQLMTHSSGLGPDQTQIMMQLWLDTPSDRSDLAAKTALERGAQMAVSGAYSYNNENYAILGAMIAAQTGEAYDAYCDEVVLQPAGITTAQLSLRTGGMAAWGGWQMSVQDYARLMHWGYGPEGKIGSAPQDYPQIATGGGAFYGVGMSQRAFGDAMNYWHFGALCFPGRLNIGSYAVSWMDEWSVVVAYDACVDWEAMMRLDSVLAQAVFE